MLIHNILSVCKILCTLVSTYGYMRSILLWCLQNELQNQIRQLEAECRQKGAGLGSTTEQLAVAEEKIQVRTCHQQPHSPSVLLGGGGVGGEWCGGECVWVGGWVVGGGGE